MKCRACGRPARWAPDRLGPKCRRKLRAKTTAAMVPVPSKPWPLVEGQQPLFETEGETDADP